LIFAAREKGKKKKMTDVLAAILLTVGFLAVWAALSYLYHKCVRHSGQIVSRTFPNGMTLHHIGGDTGTHFVYKEIFVDKAYFKHGISLDGIEGPVVIDAGANIGLFSLFIAKNFPTAKVFGAEPVPLLHQAAERNTKPYADRVKLFRGGLGKASGSAAFDFDPGFSAGASMHKDEIQKDLLRSGLAAILRASVHDLGLVGTLPKPIAQCLESILSVPVLNYVFLVVALPLIVLFIVFDMPRQRKIAVSCEVITIPELLVRLAGERPRHIDFVKIDVEGAEWDVLLGIDDEMWATIEQIIVEVHNLEDRTRLEAVKSLLRSKGFANVTQDEEEFEIHKIMDMGTVFATKSKATDSKIKKQVKRAPSTPRSKGKKAE
jgi:hypothetical protein